MIRFRLLGRPFFRSLTCFLPERGGENGHGMGERRGFRLDTPFSATILAIAVAVLAFGCGTLAEPTALEKSGSSGILKTNIPPDAVTFDILIVRVPHQERGLIDELWFDVDEQEVTPEVRQRLSDNGFRAGILGASIPESLAKLMALKGRAIRQTVEEEIPTETDTAVPLTLSKVETLQPGNKCVIKTLDEPVERIPVLSSDLNGVSGRTYEKAETKLSIRVRPISDGSVNFELTPFLTFGQAQTVTKYKYSQILRSVEQPTKTFDDLCCSMALRPGQFLVIGPSNVKTTGLGHYFFAQGVGDYEQQIVVIRLLFTQHDERFYHFPGFKEILDRKIKEETLAANGANAKEENFPFESKKKGE